MIIESNNSAPALLNLSHSLQKNDKMLCKYHILLFSTCLINSIKHEHSCKILYLKRRKILRLLMGLLKKHLVNC